MGWDDLIDIGLDVADFLLKDDDTDNTLGFDAMVTTRRQNPAKSVRRGRYQLHLARFTGESGWYRCDADDFARMEPGVCAHFELADSRQISRCTRWTRTPVQISQMLTEDKGD